MPSTSRNQGVAAPLLSEYWDLACATCRQCLIGSWDQLLQHLSPTVAKDGSRPSKATDLPTCALLCAGIGEWADQNTVFDTLGRPVMNSALEGLCFVATKRKVYDSPQPSATLNRNPTKEWERLYVVSAFVRERGAE